MPLVNVTVKNFKQNIGPDIPSMMNPNSVAYGIPDYPLPDGWGQYPGQGISNQLDSGSNLDDNYGLDTNDFAFSFLITMQADPEVFVNNMGMLGYWSFGTKQLKIFNHPGVERSDWIDYGDGYNRTITSSGAVQQLYASEYDPCGLSFPLTDADCPNENDGTPGCEDERRIGFHYWRSVLGKVEEDGYIPDEGNEGTWFKTWRFDEMNPDSDGGCSECPGGGGLDLIKTCKVDINLPSSVENAGYCTGEGTFSQEDMSIPYHNLVIRGVVAINSKPLVWSSLQDDWVAQNGNVVHIIVNGLRGADFFVLGSFVNGFDEGWDSGAVIADVDFNGEPIFVRSDSEGEIVGMPVFNNGNHSGEHNRTSVFNNKPESVSTSSNITLNLSNEIGTTKESLSADPLDKIIKNNSSNFDIGVSGIEP